MLKRIFSESDIKSVVVNGSSEERAALIEQFLPDLRRCIRREIGKNGNVDEYVGDVCLLLSARMSGFNLNKWSFGDCLPLLVKEAVKGTVRQAQLIQLPVDKLAKVNKAFAVKKRIEAETGEVCSLEDAAEEAGIDLADLMDAKNVMFVKDIDEPIGGEDDGYTFGDTIASSDDAVFVRSEAREAIHACINALLFEGKINAEDAKCFYAYYCPENGAFHTPSMADLADDLGYASVAAFKFHLTKVEKVIKGNAGCLARLAGCYYAA